jgi:hypothetical protein
MLLANSIVATICGLVSLPASGQESPISQAHVTILTSAPFVGNADADGTQPGVTARYTLLLADPLFFDPCCGAESNFDEMLPAKPWSPVVLAGPVIPDPRFVAQASVTTRRWYPYDVSNLNIERRSFARTEHRRAFYNSAPFNSYGLNRLGRFTNRDEPAFVFGYKFSR